MTYYVVEKRTMLLNLYKKAIKHLLLCINKNISLICYIGNNY